MFVVLFFIMINLFFIFIFIRSLQNWRNTFLTRLTVGRRNSFNKFRRRNKIFRRTVLAMFSSSPSSSSSAEEKKEAKEQYLVLVVKLDRNYEILFWKLTSRSSSTFSLRRRTKFFYCIRNLFLQNYWPRRKKLWFCIYSPTHLPTKVTLECTSINRLTKVHN